MDRVAIDFHWSASEKLLSRLGTLVPGQSLDITDLGGGSARLTLSVPDGDAVREELESDGDLGSLTTRVSRMKSLDPELDSGVSRAVNEFVYKATETGWKIRRAALQEKLHRLPGGGRATRSFTQPTGRKRKTLTPEEVERRIGRKLSGVERSALREDLESAVIDAPVRLAAVKEDARTVSGHPLSEGSYISARSRCDKEQYIDSDVCLAKEWFSLKPFHTEQDWVNFPDDVAEALQRARTRATADAMQAVKDWIAENGFACEDPCSPIVEIELWEPPVPGPSISGQSQGSVTVGGGLSTSGPSVSGSSSFVNLFVNVRVVWTAKLRCLEADVPEEISEDDRTQGGVMDSAGPPEGNECPCQKAWGYGRAIARLAWRPDEHSAWEERYWPMDEQEQRFRDQLIEDAYYNAAQHAIDWLGSIQMKCPPSCPVPKSSFLFGPIIRERHVRPSAPRGQVLNAEYNCLWQATYCCSD